jgi:1,4-alpha-glucan branching enzyme
MGQEFGQYNEWYYKISLDWHLLQYDVHAGARACLKDLNHLYKREKSLYQNDADGKGFEWIECDDYENSTLSFIRSSDEDYTINILNFTPEVRNEYRIGVPEFGYYEEIFNSDSCFYAGSNVGNGGGKIHSDEIPMHGQRYSIKIVLPPLAGIIFKKI